MDGKKTKPKLSYRVARISLPRSPYAPLITRHNSDEKKKVAGIAPISVEYLVPRPRDLLCQFIELENFMQKMLFSDFFLVLFMTTVMVLKPCLGPVLGWQP